MLMEAYFTPFTVWSLNFCLYGLVVFLQKVCFDHRLNKRYYICIICRKAISDLRAAFNFCDTFASSVWQHKGN